MPREEWIPGCWHFYIWSSEGRWQTILNTDPLIHSSVSNPLLTWWLSGLTILNLETLMASFPLVSPGLPQSSHGSFLCPMSPANSYLFVLFNQTSWKSLVHQWFLSYSLHSIGMNLFYPSIVIFLGFQEEAFVKCFPFSSPSHLLFTLSYPYTWSSRMTSRDTLTTVLIPYCLYLVRSSQWGALTSMRRPEGGRSKAVVFILSAVSLWGCLRLAEFLTKGHSFCQVSHRALLPDHSSLAPARLGVAKDLVFQALGNCPFVVSLHPAHIFVNSHLDSPKFSGTIWMMQREQKTYLSGSLYWAKESERVFKAHTFSMLNIFIFYCFAT